MRDLIERLRRRTVLEPSYVEAPRNAEEIPDEDCHEAAAELARLRAEVERLRFALKDTKHFFLGHFDDSCEECRRGLGIIDAALAPAGKGGE